MNYDQRIQFLKDWFGSDMLSRFNMPRDLDPKIVAMDVIETINRNIPNDTNKQRMSSLVASITKEVTQSAKTRTLPSVKEFMDAVRIATQSGRAPRSVQTTAQFDDYQLNADRIRQRAAVSDMYLRNPHRKKLIQEYHLTEEDFHPYDKWVEHTAHKQ